MLLRLSRRRRRRRTLPLFVLLVLLLQNKRIQAKDTGTDDDDDSVLDNGEAASPQRETTCLLDHGTDLYIWSSSNNNNNNSNNNNNNSTTKWQVRRQAQPWLGDFAEHPVVELSIIIRRGDGADSFPVTTLTTTQQATLWGTTRSNTNREDDIILEVRKVPVKDAPRSADTDTTTGDDDDDLSSAWWTACLPHRHIAPLALDLDRSGAVEHIATTATTTSFQFDLSGNGQFVELHHWIAPTEGILLDARRAMMDEVLSPRHYRSVYQQQHLLRSATRDRHRALQKLYRPDEITGKYLYLDMDGLFRDGFDKLAFSRMMQEHTTTTDDGMIIDDLGGLAIWIDRNINGRVERGEVEALSQYGIVALDIRSKDNAFAILHDNSTMLLSDRGGLL